MDQLMSEYPRWYVLRDLKRANAKTLGYQALAEAGIEVFTPLRWVVETRGAKKVRRQRPVITDLVFAHAMRDELDRELEGMPSMQYRYVRGAYCKPMTVGDAEMEMFIKAVNNSPNTSYFTPDEISSLAVGSLARVIGGPMDGLEGRILKVRGARRKRILISLESLIAASVEIEPEFLQLLD